MTSFNSSRRKGLRDLGEAWFWCQDCPEQEKHWQFGGIDGLRKHRRLVHGIDEWPITDNVDGDRFILTADGDRLLIDDVPVPAPLHKSWIRTRPSSSRLYHNARLHREGR